MYIQYVFNMCSQPISFQNMLEWTGTGWDLCGHVERTRFQRFQILRLQSLQRQGEDDSKGSNVLFPWPRWLGKYLLKCEISWTLNLESLERDPECFFKHQGNLNELDMLKLFDHEPYSIIQLFTCQGRCLWLDLRDLWNHWNHWDYWILGNEVGDVRRSSHDWLALRRVRSKAP